MYKSIAVFLSVAIFAIVQVHGEEGLCSWYGDESLNGAPTGCETEFIVENMDAAHRTLACGTKIRVINLENQETVDVNINDRGPFVEGRILDLTREAFRVVADLDKGTFRCTYEILF